MENKTHLFAISEEDLNNISSYTLQLWDFSRKFFNEDSKIFFSTTEKALKPAKLTEEDLKSDNFRQLPDRLFDYDYEYVFKLLKKELIIPPTIDNPKITYKDDDLVYNCVVKDNQGIKGNITAMMTPLGLVYEIYDNPPYFSLEDCSIMKGENSYTLIRNFATPLISKSGEEIKWERLNDDFAITKPTIVCMGGNGLTQEWKTNSFCKTARNLVGASSPISPSQTDANNGPIDVIGISYNKKFSGEHSGITTLSTKEIEDITKRLLVPLVQDQNGERLSIETASKNASMLTFFTNCHGTNLANRLFNNLSEEMQLMGYTEEETHQVLSNLSSINFSPENTYEKEANQDVQQFYIKSLQDDVLDYKVDLRKQSQISPEGLENSGKFSFVQTRENSFTLFASHIRPLETLEEESDHEFKTIQRDEDWQSKVEDERVDAVSQCVGYALARETAVSLQNETSEELIPKPTTAELIEECKDILGQENIYNNEEELSQ